MVSHESAFGADRVLWYLGDLYSDVDDAELERDLTESEEAVERFDSVYRGKVSRLDTEELVEACRAQEAALMPLYRVLAYAELRLAQRGGDADAQFLLGQCHHRLAAAASRMAFFELEWNVVSEPQAAALLLDEDVGPYRHSMEKLRRYRPYQLGVSEERILAELSQSGTMAWERLFDHLVGGISVEFEGKSSGLGRLLPILYEPDRSRRKTMHEAVSRALNENLQTRTIVLNALANDRVTRDRLRGHSHWLQSCNIDNGVSDVQVRALLEAVEDRYDIVARYYRLKTRLLGLDQLLDYDRYAALTDGTYRTVEWEEAVETVLDAYGGFSPRFRRTAAEFVGHGWIDASPRPGKQRGAFARATTPDHHPYVLVNFTGQMRDVLTLAHELGHGVHMRLAQRQTLANADPPLILSETASLFCEALTMGRLLEVERDPSARLTLLARYIEDLFVAVFRHTAMHKFEDAVRGAIWNSGEVGVDDINEEWLRTQGQMFGGTVTITDTYGSWWSYVPYFYLEPGSAYVYVFGNLIALALYRRYQHIGKEFVAPYEKMLSAGGSRSPVDLLSSLGVDLEDQAFWQEGLDTLEDYVREAEQLAEQLQTPLG